MKSSDIYLIEYAFPKLLWSTNWLLLAATCIYSGGSLGSGGGGGGGGSEGSNILWACHVAWDAREVQQKNLSKETG